MFYLKQLGGGQRTGRKMANIMNFNLYIRGYAMLQLSHDVTIYVTCQPFESTMIHYQLIIAIIG